MANQITFLNHSCVILITPNIKILCDPWFNGTAFGRGTVTINSRINFNYDFAHNFFLFFFIFYANNLGIYFHELNRITKDKVQSISRTSVMESILLFNKNSSSNMSKDIEYFMSIFDTKENLDSNFDIFNQEPPNSDM